MKFMFFYSPLYEYYKDHIIENLGSIMEVEPILIDDLQKNPKEWHTFAGGVTIKIQLIIEKIKENIGNYIIFSDATLFINKHNVDHITTFFDSYKKYDITFADNTGFGYHYNIGIMLIRCTNEMLYYFTTILDNIKITNGWDQAVINQTIIRTPFSIGCFDSTKIHCGDNFNTNYKNDFLIYKSFIKHTNNPIDNYNERFKTFLIAGLIDKEEYDKAIK